MRWFKHIPTVLYDLLCQITLITAEENNKMRNSIIFIFHSSEIYLKKGHLWDYYSLILLDFAILNHNQGAFLFPVARPDEGDTLTLFKF